jgi:AraC family transcriptional regulator
MTRTEVRMQVDIVEQPARRLGTVRHVGPYHGVGQAFGTLGGLLASSGAEKDATEMLALFHDDPRTVAADTLRSDACVALPDGVPMPAGLVEQRLPAATCASIVHVGPYEQLPAVWAQLGQWMGTSGRRPAEMPSWEIYLNDPRVTPPSDLRTQLCVPLA